MQNGALNISGPMAGGMERMVFHMGAFRALDYGVRMQVLGGIGGRWAVRDKMIGARSILPLVTSPQFSNPCSFGSMYSMTSLGYAARPPICHRAADLQVRKARTPRGPGVIPAGRDGP